MKDKKIRLVIADDHTIVRIGLSSLLGNQKDMEVVAEASDGRQAVDLVRTLKPDIVIMDLMMPALDGAAATREICRESAATRVLILTTFDTSALLSAAIRNGAAGAVAKEDGDDVLLKAIRTLAAGETFLTPEIKSFLESDTNPELTERQTAILQAASLGFTTEEIARQFDITPDGVKKQFHEICARLNASNRLEAVAIALRRQLLKD